MAGNTPGISKTILIKANNSNVCFRVEFSSRMTVGPDSYMPEVTDMIDGKTQLENLTSKYRISCLLRIFFKARPITGISCYRFTVVKWGKSWAILLPLTANLGQKILTNFDTNGRMN